MSDDPSKIVNSPFMAPIYGEVLQAVQKGQDLDDLVLALGSFVSGLAAQRHALTKQEWLDWIESRWDKGKLDQMVRITPKGEG